MDNGYMHHEYYMKDMFKTAVKVGAGLKLGWYLAKCVIVAVDSISTMYIKKMAGEGDTLAKTCCELVDIQYTTKSDSKGISHGIGFHVE